MHSATSHHSQLSNSFDRADDLKVIEVAHPQIENRRKSKFYETNSHCRCQSQPCSGRETQESKTEQATKTSQPETMIYFRARQQLIEKEQELVMLRKTMDDKNAKLQAKKIQKQQFMNMNQENQPIDYNRIGSFDNYLKIQHLKNMDETVKVEKKSKLVRKTKKLMKRIPQNVLDGFHIPRYCRA